MKLKETVRHLLLQYVNDAKQRKKIQSQAIYGAFAVIAFVMSMVNVFTMRIPLLISTAAFCVLCALNLVLSRFGKEKGSRLAENLFVVEIYALFMFFLITGGTDNFSVVWLLMLPTVGLLFFGRKKGTVLCAVVWISMLLLFHYPPLRSFCTDYGNTYRLRFPIVYASCFAVSWMLESIRDVTAQELERARRMYEDLYKRDALTGTMNRYGMYEFYEHARENGVTNLGVAILDIDHFKYVNDTYGHSVGDDILKEFASFIMHNLHDTASLFRWGGEEFAIIDTDSVKTIENVKKLHEKIQKHVFTAGDTPLHITCSIGVTTMLISEVEKPLDNLISRADSLLYEAKEQGRNRVLSEELDKA